MCWKKLSNIDFSGWLINLAPSSGDPVPIISTCLLFTNILGKYSLWVYHLFPCVRTGSDQSWENCWTYRKLGIERQESRGKIHTFIIPISTPDQRKLEDRECQQVAENLRLVQLWPPQSCKRHSYTQRSPYKQEATADWLTYETCKKRQLTDRFRVFMTGQ